MTGRGRWGGIWIAPRDYSLIDETGSQTGVTGKSILKLVPKLVLLYGSTLNCDHPLVMYFRGDPV